MVFYNHALSYTHIFYRWVINCFFFPVKLFAKTSLCWQLHISKFTGTNRTLKFLLQVLRAHRDEVWFLQFSNNGKYLASASNDKSAIIWKVKITNLSMNIVAYLHGAVCLAVQ